MEINWILWERRVPKQGSQFFLKYPGEKKSFVLIDRTVFHGYPLLQVRLMTYCVAWIDCPLNQNRRLTYFSKNPQSYVHWGEVTILAAINSKHGCQTLIWHAVCTYKYWGSVLRKWEKNEDKWANTSICHIQNIVMSIININEKDFASGIMLCIHIHAGWCHFLYTSVVKLHRSLELTSHWCPVNTDTLVTTFSY